MTDTDQLITLLETAAQCKDDEEDEDKKIQSDTEKCCDASDDFLENKEPLRMNCIE